ncbi:AsmA-like C-terminal region-containing protein [Halovulum dunhuangense]|uniref:AsmA-like C-terminal region-containing protein n=1 Tax=Halovulum dunhuangense TaxID=1505036 RepID=A0A849L389_9RHOB|nr:AsmA-like C-terminal region-containing protein [Halovulum dunhuangense]NNU80651.1 AsmA-like C-terminal region-containing protein [Halovulum dunhuangense]
MKAARRQIAATTARRGRRRPAQGRLTRFCAFCLRETGSLVAKLVSLTAILALVVLALLDGREFVLNSIDPRLKHWIAERIGAEEITVGSVGFTLGEGADPAGLTLNDVRIGGGEGPSLSLPRIATGFQVLGGLQGALRPTSIALDGIALDLIRAETGALTLSADRAGAGAPVPLLGAGGGGGADFEAMLDAAAIFGRLEALSRLQRVDLVGADITYHDGRAGRRWVARDASAYLERGAGRLNASVTATLSDGQGASVPVQATIQRQEAAGITRYAVRFDNARPGDVAAQVALLEFLALVDAPVSGALAAEFSDAGNLLALSGALRMGAGALRPTPEREIAFDAASVYFSYDPRSDRFRLDSLDLVTERGSLRADGVVLVDRDATGAVAALVSQLDLYQVALAGTEGAPIVFRNGRAVTRLTRSPFTIEIGTLSLRDGDTRVSLSGRARPEPEGWDVALDAGAVNLPRDRLMPLWPAELRPRLRTWLDERLEAGLVTEASLHLRQRGGAREIGLDFGFRDGVARILPRMPALVGARGTGQLIDGRFELVLDAGHTGPGQGAGVDLAGSRMLVADARARPSVAEIRLEGSGQIPQLLALVDNPPLRLPSRAGQGTDMATGRAEVVATLRLPLRDGLTDRDVEADVRATLSDVRSGSLVPGRVLAAETLKLNATNDTLEIAGTVRLDDVPLEARLARPLGPDAGPATVTGSLVVTPLSVAGLGIPLPEGSLEGQGTGRFALTLGPEGVPPAYSVDLPLSGLALSIPPLGWRKSAAAEGSLQLAGRLGPAPTVEDLRLGAPGLRIEGALDISGQRLEGARLSRLALGGWLDAPLRWRAGNPAKVAIEGGRIDLRRGLPPMAGLGGGGGGGGVALDFAPREVIVTDAIRLTDLRGSLATGQAPLGRFTAQVNGRAPLSGFLREGGEVFLQSEDGGAALRAAGLFRNAAGGTLRVSLAPGGGALSGVFSLQGSRVLSDATLARLLEGATVEGLARRAAAGGEGIAFADAQGRFAIADGRVTVSGARAVGPDLGVTISGTYDTVAGRLDMNGVLSPLYALNGMFERLPLIGRLLGGRPGEGLLGANFRITGSASEPQISVNPLSILTPGAIREIFAQGAPDAPGG